MKKAYQRDLPLRMGGHLHKVSMLGVAESNPVRSSLVDTSSIVLTVRAAFMYSAWALSLPAQPLPWMDLWDICVCLASSSVFAALQMRYWGRGAVKLFLEILLQSRSFPLNWQAHPHFFLVSVLTCFWMLVGIFKLVWKKTYLHKPTATKDFASEAF